MKKIADFSKWQGDINFPLAKNDLEFCILRIQYGSITEDTKHKQYEADCIANAIPFGSYAYFRAINPNDGVAEANSMLSRINPATKFIVVDVEEVDCPEAQLIPATQNFIDTCKAKGFKVGLYSGEYFYNAHGLSAVKADFLWIAKYSTTKPNIACDLWQYTDKEFINGAGNVDCSVLNGDKPVEYFTGVAPQPVVIEAKPAPAPVPQPKPAPTPIPDVYVVKSGDTLSGISAKFNIPLSTLISLNHIQNSNLIKVGQQIHLKSPAPTPQPQAVYHKVVSGDTVSELAVRFGSTVAQIRVWNRLDAKCTIFVGKTIRVK